MALTTADREKTSMTAGYGKNWDPTQHYKNAEIAEKYDGERFSSLSGRVFNALERRLIRRAFAGVSKNAVIGDIPCGTGRLAEALLEDGRTILGMDISPEMLRVARARLKAHGDRFTTRVCDARRLPDEGVTLDAALCARVLMHFPLPEQIEFLRGVAAVTTGRVVFTQGVVTPYHRLRKRMKRLLPTQAAAIYPLTPKEVPVLLAGAGLRLVARHALAPLVSESVVFVTERVR